MGLITTGNVDSGIQPGYLAVDKDWQKVIAVNK